MIRYADPGLCPDCREPIARGMFACASCGLALRGETAQRLYSTLQQADTLLTALRGISVPDGPESDPAPSAQPQSEQPDQAGRQPIPQPRPVGPVSPVVPVVPVGPVGPPAPVPGRGLSAASVPRILLTLGAGCLLVAALVFLAVTWSALGVGGRTAILVGFTALAAGLAWLLGRRGLRAASEALTLVAHGLLVLDLLGANGAGWFGDLPGSRLLVLIGVVLLLTGTGSTLVIHRTVPDGELVAGQAMAALGTALLVIGLQGDWSAPAPTLVLAVLLAAAICAVLARLGLWVAAGGAALVIAASWLGLAGYGIARVLQQNGDWHALWVGFEVWPLLAAAVLVAAPAAIGPGLLHLPAWGRVGAAAIGHLLLAIAVLAPVGYLRPTEIALVALAVLLLSAATSLALPQPWGLVGVLTQTLAGLYAVMVAATLAARSAGRIVAEADFSWARSLAAAGDSLPGADGAYREIDQFAGWLLPLCLLCLSVAAWATRRAIPTSDRPRPVAAGVPFGAAAPALAVAAGAALVVLSLGLYPVPIWIVLALLLLVAAGAIRWWERSGDPAPLLAGIVVAAAALALSSHALWLAGPALAVTTAGAVLVHVRSKDDELACGAGVTASLGLGALVWVWGSIGGLEANGRAVLAAAVLGALVLTVPYLPDRLWRAGAATARTGIEIGAGLVFVPIAGSAVLLTAPGSQATWAAVHLTLAGAVVTAVSLLRADRRPAGWAGGALLAAASWVRLWDVGVREPEPYTLPTAVVLLGIGLLRLHRDPVETSVRALGPGLGLALVPSLLWALDEPAGLRSLLLGLAALLLVLTGVWLRWSAPLLLAGSTGALLVLRLAGPFVAGAVPRWVLIGLAGALLLGVGATWEARLQQARQVGAYVRGLR